MGDRESKGIYERKKERADCPLPRRKQWRFHGEDKNTSVETDLDFRLAWVKKGTGPLKSQKNFEKIGDKWVPGWRPLRILKKKLKPSTNNM